MHGTSSQLGEVDSIAAAVQAMPPVADVLICLPITPILRVTSAAAGRIDVGGQNCNAASVRVIRPASPR